MGGGAVLVAVLTWKAWKQDQANAEMTEEEDTVKSTSCKSIASTMQPTHESSMDDLRLHVFLKSCISITFPICHFSFFHYIRETKQEQPIANTSY